MKIITAFLHHVRVAPVVDALNDAGYRNLTLQDVKGTLKPVNESERAYSSEARLVISEVKLSLVCEDVEVIRITEIIRAIGKIGSEISGWVYVSPIEQALPIGGSG
jgi:nitrogen regulatory protein P-II 1